MHLIFSSGSLVEKTSCLATVLRYKVFIFASEGYLVDHAKSAFAKLAVDMEVLSGPLKFFVSK